jgi:hypothetical protein
MTEDRCQPMQYIIAIASSGRRIDTVYHEHWCRIRPGDYVADSGMRHWKVESLAYADNHVHVLVGARPFSWTPERDGLKEGVSASPDAARAADRRTPGPWHVYEHDGEAQSISGPNGETICLLFDENPLPHEDQDEANANAYLLAAAPALCAALEAVVAQVDFKVRACGSAGHFEESANQARAALAAARGEAANG